MQSGPAIDHQVSMTPRLHRRVTLEETGDSIDKWWREENNIPRLRWEGHVDDVLTVVSQLPDGKGPNLPRSSSNEEDWRRFWSALSADPAGRAFAATDEAIVEGKEEVEEFLRVEREAFRPGCAARRVAQRGKLA